MNIQDTALTYLVNRIKYYEIYQKYERCMNFYRKSRLDGDF